MGKPEPSIHLHPTKGVNAHMTRCVSCGEDGEDIILLGIKDSKFTCNGCGMVHYGFRFIRTCEKCGSSNLKKEKVEDNERLPGMCKKCREAREAVDAEVKKGGVLLECEECRMQGAVKAGHPLAKEVREKLGVPEGPCALRLSKCSEHSDAVSVKKN